MGCRTNLPIRAPQPSPGHYLPAPGLRRIFNVRIRQPLWCQHLQIITKNLKLSSSVPGLAITCYQCNSHNDSRCLLDKLPDSLRLPCGPKDTMCRKISQVVEFEMNGMPPDSRVIRGCGWDESSYKVSRYSIINNSTFDSWLHKNWHY